MPNVSKKPRLNNASFSFVEAIHREETKEEFGAELASVSSQEELTALYRKLQEMNSVLLKRMLELQRKERAQRKSQKEEEHRAIYQVPTTSGSSNNNSRPYLTIEAATALLDSGFLTPEDTGKLYLLTGKFFLSGLAPAQRDHVWKHIFEAKFHNSPHGLAPLYQSNKFTQVLAKKGYEWMFRHFFVKFPSFCAPHSVFPDGEYPTANLDCQSLFFIFLLEFKLENGDKTIHTLIIDEEDTIDQFVSRDCHLPLPFDETLKRMKKKLDITEGSQEDYSSEYLCFSLLAIRMDTNECAKLLKNDNFMLSRDDEDKEELSIDEDRQDIPVNNVGNDILMRLKKDLRTVLLQLSVSLTIEAGIPVSCHAHFLVTTDFWNFGLDFYKVLDYGIDWY